MRTYRLLAVLGLLLALIPAAAGPAAAAGRATHVRAGVDLATVHVGSSLVVSGSATPVRPGAVVTLQRFDGHTWKHLAQQNSSSTGTFVFAIHAARTTATWLLRVVRGSGGGDKAGTSATLHVRVVKPVFAVTATARLSAGQGHVVVTGTVKPKASGAVRLQQLKGKAWNTVATGKVTKAGTFTVAVTIAAAGAYSIRVLKTFSTTTAQGASKTLHVTVPVADPQVTTASLAEAVVGRPYSRMLTATQGVGPYTWSVTGLPTGLSVSATGVVSGTTVLPGVFPLTATVTDSRGRSGSASLSLTVAQTHVLAWGWDDSGQVGDGGPGNRLTAVPMQGIDAVTAIAGISGFALLLRADGTVWGVGDNESGELGLGPVTSAPHPTPVPGLTPVVAMAVGQGFSYVLTADGTVWASGSNSAGQLGDGSTVARRVFSPVLGLGRALSIAANINGGFAVLADHTVWAWGSNVFGQLGQGTTTGYSSTPVPVPGLTTAVSVAGSGLGAYVLLADGTVRSWGYNADGELGNGTAVASASPVAVSGLTGVASLATNLSSGTGYALRSDGTVWAWGYNRQGSVGDGTTTNRLTPVQVPGVTGAVAISPGLDAAYAVMQDGRLLEWGEGSSGALGTGNMNNALLPIATPGVSGAVGASGGEATGYVIVTG